MNLSVDHTRVRVRLKLLGEEASNVNSCDSVEVAVVVVPLLVDPQVAPTVPDGDEVVVVDTDAVDGIATAHHSLGKFSLHHSNKHNTSDSPLSP